MHSRVAPAPRLAYMHIIAGKERHPGAGAAARTAPPHSQVHGGREGGGGSGSAKVDDKIWGSDGPRINALNFGRTIYYELFERARAFSLPAGRAGRSGKPRLGDWRPAGGHSGLRGPAPPRPVLSCPPPASQQPPVTATSFNYYALGKLISI